MDPSEQGNSEDQEEFCIQQAFMQHMCTGEQSADLLTH
jgi:hypothetical protein